MNVLENTEKCYEKKSNNKINKVKLDDLYDHFNSLLGQTLDESEDKTEMQDIIDNKLDVQITKDEVRKAIFKQENNKASGPDEISVEIIKSSYIVVST